MSIQVAVESRTRGARVRVPRGLPIEAVLSIVLAAGVLAWSVVMAASYLGIAALPGSDSVHQGLLLVPPVLMAIVWIVVDGPVPAAWKLATAWTAVVAAGLYLIPQVLMDPTLLATLPGIALITWAMIRWPAAGVVTLLAITGSYGSIAAYLGWPYNRMMFALLGGLWLALIVRTVTRRREQALSLPLGVIVAVLFLFVTAAEFILASDRHLTLSAVELNPLYMTAMLVVAYSQWSRETHMRIVKGLLAIALLVGAYATLRLIIGPSTAERDLAGSSNGFFTQFNFVDGNLKLLGSFPNGADLSAWTAIMIPFVVSCALGLRGRLQQVCVVALPLLAVALFGSQSRAAAVAMILSTLTVVLLHSATRALPSGIRLGQTLIAIGASVAIVVGAYAVGGSSTAHTGHSYLGLLQGPNHDASFQTHVYKWNEAFHDLGGHPFGYGLGTAPSATYTNVTSVYVLPVSHLGVDNGYLKIALEQGFFAAVIFGVALVLLALTLARRGVTMRDPARATISLGAAGSAIALIVLEGGNAIADLLPALACWIVVGLGLAQFVARGRPR